jgi:glycosyltransferase involved in cell wall biosynthesis
MKVSVAMATFDGARYLPEQLDSLARQTRKPDELVVADDGSRDETVAMLQQFAQTAPFDVRITTNAINLGFAQNFGRALSLCTGDVIFPCDQDDWWFEDKIATMLGALNTCPETALLLCDAMMTDEALRPGGLTKLGQIRANDLPDSAHVMGCCMALRRGLLELALPIPQSVRGHDNWIAKIADELGLTRRLGQTLQYYRRHGRNASDFYVNRPVHPSLADRLRTRVQRFARRFSSTSGMEEELGLLGEVNSRLSAREDRFTILAGRDCFDAAKQRLSRRVSALAKRLDIRRRPRVGRFVPVMLLWRAGVYRGGTGFAGAMKDLLIAAPIEKPKHE